MRKWLVVLLGATLVVLLASCNLSNLMKGGQQETNEVANEPASPPETETPPSATTPSGTQTTRPTTPSTQGSTRPTTPSTQGTTPSTQPVTPPPAEVREAKAFLGVIFITDLKEGMFRVKSDTDTLLDHSFSGKDIRVERELKVPAGTQTLKFIVINKAGARGIRTLDVNYKPRTHHTVRVVCKESPGNIALEILE
ncbi:MAG: hypothetical protein ACOYXN_03805 [Acidobacteriota bacterium]